MRAAGERPDGVRLRGVIVVLWRAGLRISEALALNETDLDPDRGALLVRHGKGDKRREVGMDRWAWSHLDTWLDCGGASGRAAVLRSARTDTRPAVRTRRASAGSSITPRMLPVCVAGSRRISCDTRMRLRCRARGSP